MTDLKFAILGTARIAQKVAPHIAKSQGVMLRGIASRDATKAADFATKYDIPVSYDSYEAVLADSEIDAVYLPLPPAMHAEWTTNCLLYTSPSPRDQRGSRMPSSA